MNLTMDFEHNKALIDEKLGIGKAFDVQTRSFIVLNTDVQLYFLDGLVSDIQIIGVMEKVLTFPPHEAHQNVIDVIHNNIAHKSVQKFTAIEEICDQVLTGVIVMVIDGYQEALGVETRSYPTRGIEEPDLEKVVRGSHDGFTETLNMNIALMRRRVRDGNLRNEIFVIGTKSKYNVCLSYIEGICDQKLVNQVRQKLQNVHVDHLVMSDKALEELLLKQKFNPYPLVRYTERADTVSVHLYKGKFAIFVDTSPSVIIAPSTFFDHLQHAEEHRQTPVSGTYLRFIRFFGVFLSIFLTPVWLLLVTINPENLPTIIEILIPDESIKLSLFIQLIAAEIGIEFLRMASIHTPSALSTSMGIVAAVLLGDIAIQVGIFSIQTVFLVAISAIGAYVTPSYELSLANKIIKLIFLFVIYLLGYVGFIGAVILWLILLGNMKSFSKRYLEPLIPLNWKELKQLLFRSPIKEVKDNAKTKM